MELLRKLLNDEVKSMSRRNVVQSRKFSEMLEKTILQYQNRTLEAAQVILELIEMAKQIRDLAERGNPLNLNEDEVAFYDAQNEAVEAAKEAARQLRLRDIGGLIVIDFIDMQEEKNRKKVLNELKNI